MTGGIFIVCDGFFDVEKGLNKGFLREESGGV